MKAKRVIWGLIGQNFNIGDQLGQKQIEWGSIKHIPPHTYEHSSFFESVMIKPATKGPHSKLKYKSTMIVVKSYRPKFDSLLVFLPW